MPPKAGHIPREASEPALYSSGMTVQDVRAVLRSSQWQALESSNDQVIFRCEFAEIDTTSTLSTEDIANIFNIRADSVRQIRRTAYVKKSNPCTPRSPDPEQEFDTIRFICKRFGSQNYVPQRDGLNDMEEKFTKLLTYGWIKRFVGPYKRNVCPATVIPEE
jgi:hypothetical protein